MTGWRLLLSLLPSGHEIGSNSHSPRFRSWRTAGEQSVSWAEYWTFVRGVFELCLARVDTEKGLWPEFIPKLDNLPPEYLAEALAALQELEVSDEDITTRIWEALDRLWRRHREYPDADWAMSTEQIAAVEQTSRLFEPAAAARRHSWLFDGGVADLGTRRGTEDYQAELERLQDAAVQDTWQEGGLASVQALASAAKSPWAVGYALGRGEYDVDSDALAHFLDSPDESQRAMSQAFLKARHRTDFSRLRALADSLGDRPLAQARVFQLADDVESAWAAVRERGKEVDEAYWREFYPYGRGADFPLGVTAARHLAEHGRLALALDALAHYRDGREPNDPMLVVETLLRLVREGDPEFHVLSAYDFNHLMTMLRESPTVDEDTVAQLEWALLPVIDSDPTSSSLQRRLARSPEFFIEVLSLVYRAENEDPGEPTEARQKIATNAWRLLHDWTFVPGAQEGSSEVDSDVLRSWVRSMQALADAADRREVADLQVGEVLARSRVTDDGTWPPTGVVSVLEDLGTDAMLRGFGIGAYNKRGVTSRGLADGGRQEFALAERYRAWAARWRLEAPRTARALRELADGYDAEGRRHDDEAQRLQEGFGTGR